MRELHRAKNSSSNGSHYLLKKDETQETILERERKLEKSTSSGRRRRSRRDFPPSPFEHAFSNVRQSSKTGLTWLPFRYLYFKEGAVLWQLQDLTKRFRYLDFQERTPEESSKLSAGVTPTWTS